MEEYSIKYLLQGSLSTACEKANAPGTTLLGSDEDCIKVSQAAGNQYTDISETAVKIPKLSDEHLNVDDCFNETSQSGTKKEVNKRFDETLTAGPNPCPALEKAEQTESEQLHSSSTSPKVIRLEEETFNKFRKEMETAGQTKQKRLPSSSPFQTGIILEEGTFKKLRNMIEKGKRKEKRLSSSSTSPTVTLLEEETFNKLRNKVEKG
ncbi:uncharacterized protein LOC121386608 [Gigantopelta aegis]|uniref:uncharacterized protein LOC121386608 n=1 Tax=Gigantopelta aegis TaxID=1735272 RepID=UPI001B888E21|nr:uncharacterized protein LOC121386608 [Gigantopelta aegis]